MINLKHLLEITKLELNNKQMKDTEKYISDFISGLDTIHSLNTDGVIPYISPVIENLNMYSGIENNRDDLIKNSLPKEEILKNSPKTQHGQIVVDAIIEGE